MKIKYLGTGAYEGLPAMFCECENCREARKRGGKNIRTRSQALINDELLIDFNCDTYIHMLTHNFNMSDITDCIITHAHSDHLYAENINLRLPTYSRLVNKQPFCIYGSETVTKTLKSEAAETEKDNTAVFITVKPYETFRVSGFEITPLPALHDPKSGPFIYIIKDNDKCMLYANDTGIFYDEVFDYLKNSGIYFNFISLDCTAGFMDIDYDSHMNIKRNLLVRDRLYKNGNADENTIIYLNHFSHNATDVLYEEMTKKANELGFLVTYDGLEAEF